MNTLIIGSGGFIGSALLKAIPGATGTTRKELDLLNPDVPGGFDVIYLCAAKSRFIDCEEDRTAYRINVDAPISIARHTSAKLVFLSSDVVERALHTNYAMHKALAEAGLWAVCRPVIARICCKVTEPMLPELCGWLKSLAFAESGVYRWGQLH